MATEHQESLPVSDEHILKKKKHNFPFEDVSSQSFGENSNSGNMTPVSTGDVQPNVSSPVATISKRSNLREKSPSSLVTQEIDSEALKEQRKKEIMEKRARKKKHRMRLMLKEKEAANRALEKKKKKPSDGLSTIFESNTKSTAAGGSASANCSLSGKFMEKLRLQYKKDILVEVKKSRSDALTNILSCFDAEEEQVETYSRIIKYFMRENSCDTVDVNKFLDQLKNIEESFKISMNNSDPMSKMDESEFWECLFQVVNRLYACSDHLKLQVPINVQHILKLLKSRQRAVTSNELSLDKVLSSDELEQALRDIERIHLCVVRGVYASMHNMLYLQRGALDGLPDGHDFGSDGNNGAGHQHLYASSYFGDLGCSNIRGAVKMPLNNLTCDEISRLSLVATLAVEMGWEDEDIVYMLRGSNYGNNANVTGSGLSHSQFNKYTSGRSIAKLIRQKLYIKHFFSNGLKAISHAADANTMIGGTSNTGTYTSELFHYDVLYTDFVPTVSMFDNVESMRAHLVSIATNDIGELLGNDASADGDRRAVPLTYTDIYQRCARVLLKILNLISTYLDDGSSMFVWDIDSGYYPEYYETIRYPMVLSHIATKLVQKAYSKNGSSGPSEYVAVGQAVYKDLVLMCMNCLCYHTERVVEVAHAYKILNAIRRHMQHWVFGYDLVTRKSFTWTDSTADEVSLTPIDCCDDQHCYYSCVPIPQVSRKEETERPLLQSRPQPHMSVRCQQCLAMFSINGLQVAAADGNSNDASVICGYDAATVNAVKEFICPPTDDWCCMYCVLDFATDKASAPNATNALIPCSFSPSLSKIALKEFRPRDESLTPAVSQLSPANRLNEYFIAEEEEAGSGDPHMMVMKRALECLCDDEKSDAKNGQGGMYTQVQILNGLSELFSSQRSIARVFHKIHTQCNKLKKYTYSKSNSVRESAEYYDLIRAIANGGSSEEVSLCHHYLGDVCQEHGRVDSEIVIAGCCMVCRGSTYSLEAGNPKKDKEKEKLSDNKVILCDGCNGEVHLICLNLKQVPYGTWYCSKCNQRMEARDEAARATASFSELYGPQLKDSELLRSLWRNNKKYFKDFEELSLSSIGSLANVTSNSGSVSTSTSNKITISDWLKTVKEPEELLIDNLILRKASYVVRKQTKDKANKVDNTSGGSLATASTPAITSSTTAASVSALAAKSSENYKSIYCNSQPTCQYCGFTELECCSPMVIGQNRSEHIASLAAFLAPIPCLLSDGDVASVSISSMHKQFTPDKMHLHAIPSFPLYNADNRKALGIDEMSSKPPIVHQICALQMYKLRLENYKHNSRRVRNTVTKHVIQNTGISLESLGVDDAGNEYWLFPGVAKGVECNSVYFDLFIKMKKNGSDGATWKHTCVMDDLVGLIEVLDKKHCSSTATCASASATGAIIPQNASDHELLLKKNLVDLLYLVKVRKEIDESKKIRLEKVENEKRMALELEKKEQERLAALAIAEQAEREESEKQKELAVEAGAMDVEDIPAGESSAGVNESKTAVDTVPSLNDTNVEDVSDAMVVDVEPTAKRSSSRTSFPSMILQESTLNAQSTHVAPPVVDRFSLRDEDPRSMRLVKDRGVAELPKSVCITQDVAYEEWEEPEEEDIVQTTNKKKTRKKALMSEEDDEEVDEAEGDDLSFQEYFKFHRSKYYGVAFYDENGKKLKLKPVNNVSVTYQIHRLRSLTHQEIEYEKKLMDENGTTIMTHSTAIAATSDGTNDIAPDQYLDTVLHTPPLAYTPLTEPWSDGVYYFSSLNFKKSGLYAVSFLCESIPPSSPNYISPIAQTAANSNRKSNNSRSVDYISTSSTKSSTTGTQVNHIPPQIHYIKVVAKNILHGNAASLYNLNCGPNFYHMNNRDYLNWSLENSNVNADSDLIEQLNNESEQCMNLNEFDMIRHVLLRLYASLPSSSMNPGNGSGKGSGLHNCKENFVSLTTSDGWSVELDALWRKTVLSATTAIELMECTLLLESCLNKAILISASASSSACLKLLSVLPSPHYALKCATLSSVALRLYSLDKCIAYSKIPRRSDVHVKSNNRTQSNSRSGNSNAVNHTTNSKEDISDRYYNLVADRPKRAAAASAASKITQVSNDLNRHFDESDPKGGSVGSATVRTPWNCSACSYENSPRARYCQMCNQMKPDSSAVQAQSQQEMYRGSFTNVNKHAGGKTVLTCKFNFEQLIENASSKSNSDMTARYLEILQTFSVDYRSELFWEPVDTSVYTDYL